MYCTPIDCFVPRNDGRTSLPKAHYNKYNTIIVANDSKGMKNLLE